MQTERPDSFSFTLLEVLNEDVLKAVYGDSNVIVDDQTGSITVKATADELNGGSWIIDMIMRGGRKKRIVIPNGTISELGTITYKDDEASIERRLNKARMDLEIAPLFKHVVYNDDPEKAYKEIKEQVYEKLERLDSEEKK